MQVRIVIVDDHPGSLEMLTAALKRPDLEIHLASSPAEGLRLIRELHPRLVLTDLVMPGMTGLDLLRETIAFDPAIDVILMTAHYTTETAVEAIRSGAADYLQKPVKIGDLRSRVSALIESSQRRAKVAGNKEQDGGDAQFEGMTSRSVEMWDLFDMLRRIAPHYRTVLLTGPTGSGKELVANALHRQSKVPGQLITVNCSAITETLFESEMFGHVKGAFTGADRDKPGLFELANGGTLFLDEIGDMPLSTQAKLLRAVQNQEVLRVGSLHPKRVNVRVIAATHRNLRADVANGRFREDLFFRLSMVELKLPPLKDRGDDVALLAHHFLKRYCAEYGKGKMTISPRTQQVLQRYAWPGNVRELEHVIGRACMLAEDVIDVQHLPETLLEAVGRPARQEQNTSSASLAENEKQLVVDALRQANGNQSEAARRLGIGRDALRYKVKKYDLT